MSGMTIKQALAVIQTEVNYHAGSDTHYRAERLEQSLATLRAEIARLEKDAGRYRWQPIETCPHKAVAWARPVYAKPVGAPEAVKGEMVDIEFHSRPEKPEGEGWRPLVLADTGTAVIDHWPRQAVHPAITFCDNCGCDWLDNGLNPVGCPYCKQNDWRAAFVAERATRYREGGMAIEQARIHAETDAALILTAALATQHQEEGK